MNADRFDILISRVIDREDTTADWDELDRLPQSEAREDLWHALRQDTALRQRVGEVLESAHVRPVESGPLESAPVETTPTTRRRRSAASTLVSFAGWAAAALIAFAWGFSAPPERDVPDESAVTTVEPAAVIGELPEMIVRAEPAANGTGFDVFVMRRIVERKYLPELYELELDEYGDPVPARVSPDQLTRPATY